jgi:hypothetical protein
LALGPVSNRIYRLVSSGSIWLLIAFRLPLVLALLMIWWASRRKPDESSPSDDDGGIKYRPRPHQPRPFPHRPRRGPHGDPAPPPPARTRTVRARARQFDH